MKKILVVNYKLKPKIRIILNSLEDTKKVLLQKYRNITWRQPAIIDSVIANVPQKMVEWVVKLIDKQDIRWPEDKNRLIAAYEFFHRSRGNQRFKELVGIEYPGKHFKNILDFDLRDIESLEDELQAKKSKREEIREIKQKGAEKVYDDGTYQIIKVLTGEAACYYSKGTKWCTSDPEVAEQYLEQSPLYIIFKGNEKVAQMRLTSQHLMDIKDKDLDITSLIPGETRKDIGDKLFAKDKKEHIDYMLLTEGTVDKKYEKDFVEMIEKDLTDSKGAKYYQKTKDTVKKYLVENYPSIKDIIASDPFLTLEYAEHVIKKPWPPGEKTLLKSLSDAVRYSTVVLGTRWKELEEKLLNTKISMFMTEPIIYALNVIKGRWPELERKIKRDASEHMWDHYQKLMIRAGYWY